MKNKISVIIPAYNRSSLIGQTIDSIINQLYQNWECLIIDDGSTDYTPELIEFYCRADRRLKYYRRPVELPKGANSCRNYGFKICSGELICWFDSDDLMSPDYLANHFQSFQNSDIKISISSSVYFLENSNTLIKRPKFSNDLSLKNQHILLKRNFLTPEVVWRKKYFENYKYIFDEELKAAQEWEFYARCLNDEINYKILQEPLVFVRQHTKNITTGKSEKFLLWNYFLARYKIYNNKKIEQTELVKSYLRSYLLGSYKNMIWKGYYDIALKAFWKFILREKQISTISKIRAILALISFRVFKKGSFLLNKIALDEV